MKSILVPTDFSPFSNSATHVAAQIAAKTGAGIILMHNVGTFLKWDNMSTDEQERHPETYDRTLAAEAKMRELSHDTMFDNVAVTPVVTHGVTDQEIVSKAAEYDADMIIMGSHGSESSTKNFIGSNLQRVLREANCPVLSIKKDAGERQWEKLVFAASFDEDLVKPFEQVRNIIADLGATVHLTYVNMPSQFKNTRLVYEQMDRFASNYPELKFVKAVYNQHDLDNGILEYSKDIHADWIAMITHDRRTSPEYLIGVTESVVYHADTPVLSVTID